MAEVGLTPKTDKLPLDEGFPSELADPEDSLNSGPSLNS